MKAVGIDVSKAKSIISVLCPFGEVVISPFEVWHTSSEINGLISSLSKLKGETKIVSEYTDRYQAMKGIETSLGPQLIAEICDIRRFSHRGALTTFAGVDPGVNQYSSYNQKNVRTSKQGSVSLRKTRFQVMGGLLKSSPENDSVYKFISKKRAEGKTYYVYTTAGANKFLRIYYGRVKEYLLSLPNEE